MSGKETLSVTPTGNLSSNVTAHDACKRSIEEVAERGGGKGEEGKGYSHINIYISLEGTHIIYYCGLV